MYYFKNPNQMKKKKKPKNTLFETSQEARNFLRNQYFNACLVKDCATRKLQLLEICISPEFRVALAVLKLSLSKKNSSYMGVSEPKDFSEAISPVDFTEITSLGKGYSRRTFFNDLKDMIDFYSRNHIPGNP